MKKNARIIQRWKYLIPAFIFLVSLNCRESLIAPGSGHVPLMKGFAYTSFTAIGFRQGGERNALGRLKNQINNDWVALTVFEYQSSPTSTDIAPNTTGINPVTGSGWSTSSTEDDIREGVRQARSANMKILLKPQLDLYTGEWRASIRPDEEGNWFASYTAMMLKYARLCNELHVEMLSIGTEYIVATQSKYTFRWRRVIDEVRRSYAGQLTYASNWSGDFAHGITQPEFSQIGFWSDLDYVGVDTYFPLTDAQSDTLPAYDVALNRAISASSQIGFVSYRYSKPVIITEIGIQSVRGALASPWDFSIGNSAGAIPDSAVQQFYYRVMIDAIGKQPWCSGMFWWHWESVTSSNAVTNYTPEDKPAAVVLRQWYSGIGI